MRVLMIVVVLMIVSVSVCVRHFRLRRRSLIRLCHLSRGQFHAFQSVCLPGRSHFANGRGLRSLLLYESSPDRVKPAHPLPFDLKAFTRGRRRPNCFPAPSTNAPIPLS